MKVTAQQQTKPAKAAMKDARPVFISYAHKDARLASAVLTLLQAGTGVLRDQCFASRMDEANIPGGYGKHEFVKLCLTASKVHIALVTPNFIRSPDCNAEAGYMWATSRANGAVFIPFKFRVGKDKKQMPWYLSDTEFLTHDKKSVLSTIRDRIDALKIAQQHATTDAWNNACSAFITEIAHLVPDIPDSIDYGSMGRFLNACARFPRILFFNVQVSFEDWFRPELQTHLALQDATTTRWQLDKVVDVKSRTYATHRIPHRDLPKYYGTPTARVLFVTQTRDELLDKLHKGDPEVDNFIDLALIHLFMATPLAVITVDQLATIMRTPPKHKDRGEIDFVERQADYPGILNLPTPAELATNEENLIPLLRERLDDMIMRPGADNNANIDFALLMQNRDAKGKQAYEVWKGGIKESPKDMEYIKIMGSVKRPVMYEFGKRIEHAVFRPLDEAEVKKTPLLRLLLKADKHARPTRAERLLANRHPCFKVFHEARRRPSLRYHFARVMKFVWPAHCPLHIISQAGGKWGEIFLLSGE